jgi:hypothetical protein
VLCLHCRERAARRLVIRLPESIVSKTDGRYFCGVRCAVRYAVLAAYERALPEDRLRVTEPVREGGGE